MSLNDDIRKAVLDNAGGKCSVFGCHEKKTAKNSYCATHSRQYLNGHLVNDIPMRLTQKVDLLYNIMEDVQKDTDSKKMTIEQAKTVAYETMKKFFDPTLKTVHTSGRCELDMDSASFVASRKKEINKKAMMFEHLRKALSNMPIAFSVVTVEKTESLFKVSLAVDISRTLGEDKGYLDEHGVFVEKSHVERLFTAAFKSGKSVYVVVEKSRTVSQLPALDPDQP